MSRFSSLFIFFFFGMISFQASAQKHNKEDDLAHSLKKLSVKIEKLGIDLADRLEDIDTREVVEEAENLARLSEKKIQHIGKQFESTTWDDLDDAAFAEKTKTIQKVYIISRNIPLGISNQFGKVEVNTWDKKEIRVDISIRAIENSLSKAENMINSITIEEEKSANNIRLTTHINRDKSNWWDKVMNSGKRGIQVNYVIFMPKSNPINIENKFGSTVLPDLDGNVALNLSYGKLIAGRLNGNNTTIRSSYGSAEIAAVQNAVLDCKYGKVDLGQAKTVALDLSYSGSSSIGELSNSGSVNMKYSGGFNVGLGKDITQFRMSAAYSSSTVRIDPAAHFGFDVSVSYGGFDCDNCTITQEDPTPESRGPKLHRSYQGYFKQPSANRVTIDSSYGSVTFKD